MKIGQLLFQFFGKTAVAGNQARTGRPLWQRLVLFAQLAYSTPEFAGVGETKIIVGIKIYALIMKAQGPEIAFTCPFLQSMS
jgi:hypothetical protein